MNQSRFIDFSKLPAISGVPSFVLSHLHYCVKNSRLNYSYKYICIQRESKGEKEWKTERLFVKFNWKWMFIQTRSMNVWIHCTTKKQTTFHAERRKKKSEWMRFYGKHDIGLRNPGEQYVCIYTAKSKAAKLFGGNSLLSFRISVGRL